MQAQGAIRTEPRAAAGYLRHPSCVPVRLREIPRPFAAGARPEGSTLGAIQFRVGRAVQAGAIVEIVVEVCGETERFRGDVHWVRRAARGFVVGVRLTDPEQAYRARAVEQICHVEAYRRRSNRRTGRALGIEQAASRWIARCARRFAEAWERPGAAGAAPG